MIAKVWKIINKAADNVWFWFMDNVYEKVCGDRQEKIAQFGKWLEETDDETLCAAMGSKHKCSGELFVKLLRAVMITSVEKFFSSPMGCSKNLCLT